MCDLSQMAMSAVFLLAEFFTSGLDPIAQQIRDLDADEKHEFFLRLLPHLVANCRELGLPHPYETALALVRMVESRSD